MFSLKERRFFLKRVNFSIKFRVKSELTFEICKLCLFIHSFLFTFWFSVAVHYHRGQFPCRKWEHYIQRLWNKQNKVEFYLLLWPWDSSLTTMSMMNACPWQEGHSYWPHSALCIALCMDESHGTTMHLYLAVLLFF